MSAAAATVPALTEPLAVISRFREHDYSLQDFLAARVERQPQACAIEFEGRQWTYAGLDALVRQWTYWLVARGVGQADTVAVMAANHPHTIALLFALARLGAILVPVNPDYGVREAAYVLGHAQVKGVVATPDKLETVTAALRDTAPAAWTAAIGDALDAELAAAPQQRSPASARACESACLIIYTSGTTGFPKGAMHGQRGFVLTAEAFVERLWLQSDERVMCVMPMFHINALMYSLGGAFACGGTLILVKRFSAGSFWHMAAATRATQVNLVAAAGSILAQRPRSEFVPGHSLGKMFVAPQTRQMVDALRNELGVPVLIECYGMTEIPGVISNPFKGPHKLGTMGILCKHPDPRIERPQARVVDDEGRDVPAGAIGELFVKTPTLMLGYYRDARQTQETFQDGWFKTGDLVTHGEDGFYRFVARKKDIIRRRGENIASAEVERIIGEHPQVAAVAVIGVPSELGEDDILAAIVLVPGEQGDAPGIAAWTADRLAAVKVPRYIAFVDEIPHTATHKPAKQRLKENPDLLRNAIDIQASASGPSTRAHTMNEYCKRAIGAMNPQPEGADAALQARTAIILKHLHAMIDELQPTDKELYTAMGWLNQVGKDNDFVMLCDVLGLTMRTVDLTHDRANATRSNVEGPFAKDDVPVYDNPVIFAGEKEQGQRMELRGTVTSAETGKPIAGALFEIWQTNHAGKYENEDPAQPPDNFRGKFHTAEDGTYSISTILPGPYEIGSLHSAVGQVMTKLGRKRFRAAHLHYRISKPGLRPLTSQVYFDGLPDNPGDCIFSARPDNMTDLKPHPQHEGKLLGEFDIRLAKQDSP